MRPSKLVWLSSGCFALLYYLFGWDRYSTYHSGADLGLFTQSISTVFRGFSNTTETGSHFTFHFSPVLYLCALPLLVAHSPLVLVAAQAVAGALVAPPIYYFARKRIPELIALRLALVALLYPPLAGVTFTDFHENGFASAATLWLLISIDARRWGAAALLLVFTLGIKEDQSVIIAFNAAVGCGYFAFRRDRAAMSFLALAVAAAVVTFLAFFEVVRPLAGARDGWAPLHFYVWNQVAASKGIAPWYSIGRPAYVLEAFFPLVFVPFIRPALLLSLPGFVEVLSSHESLTYTMGQHYAAVWIPYVLFAFAAGICRIYRHSQQRAKKLLNLSSGICVLVLVFASPTHWKHFLGLPGHHIAVLNGFVSGLPNEAPVGTIDEVYSHLGFDSGARIGIATIPEYALFDESYDGEAWRVIYRPQLREFLRTGRYRMVRTDDQITLYRRVDRH